MLKHGANINATDKLNRTHLHLAVLCNHNECVRLLLLQTEIDLNKKNSDDETAMDVAKKKGFAEIITMLEDPDQIRRNHVEGLISIVSLNSG